MYLFWLLETLTVISVYPSVVLGREKREKKRKSPHKDETRDNPKQATWTVSPPISRGIYIIMILSDFFILIRTCLIAKVRAFILHICHASLREKRGWEERQEKERACTVNCLLFKKTAASQMLCCPEHHPVAITHRSRWLQIFTESAKCHSYFCFIRSLFHSVFVSFILSSLKSSLKLSKHKNNQWCCFIFFIKKFP